MPLRTFSWWFGMGSLTTLGVLMVQGGVRDLLVAGIQTSGPHSGEMWWSFVMTILGGGVLAGCLALIGNRLR
ncbi:MAG: hypothetical protein D6704_08185 [Nitrospirae bacterium]|nr:MAG: hypothetical protein D6704_08185 [Nitrospirota bacterium]